MAYRELDEYANAEALLRKALQLRRVLHGEEHPDTMNTMFHLVEAVWPQRERRPDFPALLRESFALHLRVNGSNNVRTAEYLNRSSFEEETSAGAEILGRRALAILNTIGATNDLVFGLTLRIIGHHLLYQGRLDEAISFERQAVAAGRRVSGISTLTRLRRFMN